MDQLCHTASTGVCPHPFSQSGWKPDYQQQQQQLQAKQQDKQQEPLQQQQQEQQQQQGTWDEQQSERQQQQGQQQHQQPQDSSDGADRVHLGDQVMQAARQNQHQQQGRSDDLQSNYYGPQADQQKQHDFADQVSGKLHKKLLTKLRVRVADWHTALAAAPLPCSARQTLSALSSGHAKALPHHLVPLLLPCISRALQCIAAAQLPWQGVTATALQACAAAIGTSGRAAAAAADEAEAEAAATRRLEGLLAELGAVEEGTSAQAGGAMTQYSAMTAALSASQSSSKGRPEEVVVIVLICCVGEGPQHLKLQHPCAQLPLEGLGCA